MKMKFIVETPHPDSTGTIVDIDGVQFTNPVVLTVNYKLSIENFVAKGIVSVENGNLVCEADIDKKYLDLYPAIGFTANKWTDHGDHKHYHSIKLHQIGLCSDMNLNTGIKTLREQLTDQQNETPTS